MILITPLNSYLLRNHWQINFTSFRSVNPLCSHACNEAKAFHFAFSQKEISTSFFYTNHQSILIIWLWGQICLLRVKISHFFKIIKRWNLQVAWNGDDKLSLTGQIISIKVGKYYLRENWDTSHTTKRQLSRFGDLKHAGIASKGLKVNSSQCGWKSKQQQ